MTADLNLIDNRIQTRYMVGYENIKDPTTVKFLLCVYFPKT